jgi:hypothetical protein
MKRPLTQSVFDLLLGLVEEEMIEGVDLWVNRLDALADGVE